MKSVEEIVCNRVKHLVDFSTRTLGLSEVASHVITTLYFREFETGMPLTMKDICNSTSLSHSSISTMIKSLESAGIVSKQADTSRKGKGRKRMLVHLAGGLDHLLRLAVETLVNASSRAYDDLQRKRENSDITNPHTTAIILQLEREIASFLTEQGWSDSQKMNTGDNK
ncbi:MAG: hypothetical protein KAU48_12690 [Candidatus Thorarchaeota archaeon]|nr:hypothetical protein [Candidatus Thorarchaeota archaeon]